VVSQSQEEKMTPARPKPANRYAAATWREVLPGEVLPGVNVVGGGRLPEGERRIYFNARYYDPVTGRFLTEDPSRKGVNWYAYCENNPVNRTDPTGRQTSGMGGFRSLEHAKQAAEEPKQPEAPNMYWSLGSAGELAAIRDATVAESLRILERAKGYIGIPYEVGGTDKSGIDCSRLVANAINEAGIPYQYTRTAGMPASPYLREVPRAAARAGDVFLFPGHTGFYDPSNPMAGKPYLSAISPPPEEGQWEPGVEYSRLQTMPGEARFFRVQISASSTW
jgi:RHS repeat-associated protein